MAPAIPLLLTLGLLVAARSSPAEVFAWVDEQGGTHLTNDPEAVPESARPRVVSGEAVLRTLWAGRLAAPSQPPAARAAGRQEARTRRLLRGAVDDLRRGETARASEVLESVLRREPDRPEAHWYLAHLDRRRGRLDSAETHLRAFLVAAGDRFAAWREKALHWLEEIEDERRLARVRARRGPLELVPLDHPHFRIHYDAELGAASESYAATVLRFLVSAREEVAERLGVTPREPTGVVLYGRAAYVSAYGHRFSFQTVGFFDGRIHVVSQAHPRTRLRALLYHEYAHALYREQTGGDRPFWLNEGLAELLERAGRGQRGLGRDERALLRSRIEAGSWIDLGSLAVSFAGLDDREARSAYLEAAAAAAWLEAHTTLAARRSLLARLGEGASADGALRDVVGLDTAGVDAAVRQWVTAEFAPTFGDVPR